GAGRRGGGRRGGGVAARPRGALVLGADQLGEVDGQVLGKPADRAAARGQLRSLLGRTHRLLTAVALVQGGEESLAVDTVVLGFHALSEEELELYLDSGEWEGCAGGCRSEGGGQALVARRDGDRTSVMGLPMLAVVRMLRNRGVPVLC